MTLSITAEQRFFSFVRKTPTCWHWIGACTPTGYGRFSDGGIVFNAHRWAYERFVGKIAPRLQIDHLCRIRNCVRVEHLEAVTVAENLKRGINHNRDKTTCPHGHSYDDHNTYYRKRRGRTCRACAAIKAIERRAKAKLARLR